MSKVEAVETRAHENSVRISSRLEALSAEQVNIRSKVAYHIHICSVSVCWQLNSVETGAIQLINDRTTESSKRLDALSHAVKVGIWSCSHA